MPEQYINGRWCIGGQESFSSINPATKETVWQGHRASIEDVDKAAQAARGASPVWALTPLEERIEALHRYKDALKAIKTELALAISQEVGKPLWESETEVSAIIGKIDYSIKAFNDRCANTVQEGTPTLATRFKPHGVIAVLGPFNFPGHLPNGHIVPAVLAGNTVIFKPSHFTPYTACLMVEAWEKADVPPGVINLVHPSHDGAEHLVHHKELDGLFFTGSYTTGLKLSQHFGNHPGKILSLEMGGNNPLVIGDIDDIDKALFSIIMSAYITSGQRCSCARRLIIEKGTKSDDLLYTLMEKIKQIKIGPYDADVFMGPVISNSAATKLMETQSQLESFGGHLLVPMTQKGAFLTPGLIDVTEIENLSDEEHFGPLLQVIRTSSFEESIEQANNTRYGLSAGLLSDSRDEYDLFFSRIRAGVVNWNQPIVGASSAAPFGGLGQSGNHRPTAYFACDYCSYPIASMEMDHLSLPNKLPPGLPI